MASDLNIAALLQQESPELQARYLAVRETLAHDVMLGLAEIALPRVRRQSITVVESTLAGLWETNSAFRVRFITVIGLYAEGFNIHTDQMPEFRILSCVRDILQFTARYRPELFQPEWLKIYRLPGP